MKTHSEKYRAFIINVHQLVNGLYRAYVQRSDNSVVVCSSDCETIEDAIIDAKNELDYFLDN